MLSSDTLVAYAVFSIATGAIQWTGFCELGLLAEQAGDGEIAVLLPEGVADDTHFWDGAGFVPYPPRPGDWAVWNGAFWTDPRRPRDPQAELAARRAVTWISRANLVLNAKAMRIMPESEALAASGGEITPAIQALIDQLPEHMRFEAAVRWRTSQQIDRMNDILIGFGAVMDLTDEQLDQLTGVTPLPTPPTEE